MVVERELAIRKFVAEDYMKCWPRSTCRRRRGEHQGTWFNPATRILQQSMRYAGRRRGQPHCGARAYRAGRHRIRRSPNPADAPPALYDLTNQRHANRFWFQRAEDPDLAQTL
jgi:hypothetical protein